MKRYLKRTKNKRETRMDLDWFASIDPEVCPPRLRETYEGYEMEYMVGHPNHWQSAWLAAKKSIWNWGTPLSHLQFSTEEYKNRVAGLVYGVLDEDMLKKLFYQFDESVFMLTPVKQCHGRLLLSNVFRGQFFINPARNYLGLPCQELDEAYLLMSMDGWHERNGHSCYAYPPFVATNTHWAILATLYARELTKELPADQADYARGRISAILSMLGWHV